MEIERMIGLLHSSLALIKLHFIYCLIVLINNSFFFCSDQVRNDELRTNCIQIEGIYVYKCIPLVFVVTWFLRMAWCQFLFFRKKKSSPPFCVKNIR